MFDLHSQHVGPTRQHHLPPVQSLDANRHVRPKIVRRHTDHQDRLAHRRKLHHVSFNLTTWEQVLRAGDILSRDKTSIDIGPTRHGITRGETIYFFDPSGNRNEVFSGGYLDFPDKPTIAWYEEELGPTIFYHDRRINERFLTVFT